MLEVQWEYNGRVRRLFIDCEKAYDPGMREIMYSTLNQFATPL